MKYEFAKIAMAALAMAGAATNLQASHMEIVEGNPASPVRVLIYEDLQCTDCDNFRTLMDQKILPRYGSRVAFVHRDMPLPRHDWSRQAAIAGRWVYEQNHELGIVFRRELMAEKNHITVTSLRPWLLEFARRNNLNQQSIADSLADARLSRMVEQDYLAAVARGVTHTPTVYVGNVVFSEIILYDDLAKALDVELDLQKP